MKSKATLKELVYAHILENVVGGNYLPGSIINEKMLVEKLGVSKSPVRDALVELCNEEILRSIPRCGYEVVMLTERDIREIAQYRIILETECLCVAMQTIDRFGLQTLYKHLDRSEEQAKSADLLEHWHNNMEFHLLLASFAGNQYICQQLQKSMNILLRAYVQIYWNDWSRDDVPLDIDTHKQIVEAIAGGHGSRAVDILQEDIRFFDPLQSHSRQGQPSSYAQKGVQR